MTRPEDSRPGNGDLSHLLTEMARRPLDTAETARLRAAVRAAATPVLRRAPGGEPAVEEALAETWSSLLDHLAAPAGAAAAPIADGAAYVHQIAHAVLRAHAAGTIAFT